jgi:hypothetical protein
MADNVGYTPGVGATVAADEIGGVLHQRVKIGIGADGSATDVSAANPLPITAPGGIAVTGALTDAELRASAVPVSGPLTDAQLRADPIRISAEDSEWLLSQIVSLLTSPAGFDRSQSRARVTAILESGTVTTVTTVTAITALNNFGGLPAEAVARNQNQAAWQLCHRSTIT